MQEPETISKYFKSIHELPLRRFIDCIVDNNPSALIISGTPDPQELIITWNNILNDYTDTIGTQEYKMYKQLFCQVEDLRITLTQINACIDILKEMYVPYFVTELNQLLRTDCKLNWNDQKTYQAELKKCRSRSKSLKISLDLKNIQFEAIQKKQGKGEPMTRAYFTCYLVTLSDHAKFHLTSDILMDEYCERIKRYCEYCESLKKQAHGR